MDVGGAASGWAWPEGIGVSRPCGMPGSIGWGNVPCGMVAIGGAIVPPGIMPIPPGIPHVPPTMPGIIPPDDTGIPQQPGSPSIGPSSMQQLSTVGEERQNRSRSNSEHDDRQEEEEQEERLLMQPDRHARPSTAATVAKRKRFMDVIPYRVRP